VSKQLDLVMERLHNSKSLRFKVKFKVSESRVSEEITHVIWQEASGQAYNYRRSIAGPTLNNSGKKIVFLGNYHLMLLKSFESKVNI
jgi:hypothetical protein